MPFLSVHYFLINTIIDDGYFMNKRKFVYTVIFLIFMWILCIINLLCDYAHIIGRLAEMALKLMYITNNTEIASIIDDFGVDRIFLDLEIIGKVERQGHLDTVISRHSIDDVAKLRKVIKKGKLLVRCNPVHNAMQEEIDRIINDGADIIMLPFFKSANEVQKFLKCVDGRVKTCLLFETFEAVESADEILQLPGIDEVHIGLNDLHLEYGLTFMFELLTNGVVENLCKKLKKYGIPFGIGGIAALNKGVLPAEYIIAEHYRLGSGCAILSRSFCNFKNFDTKEEFAQNFLTGLSEIRGYEKVLANENDIFFENNRCMVFDCVKKIVEQIKI